MKPYFYIAYFHCQVVLSFMQNTLVLPFNLDIVSTLSITLVKSFQIHICQNKDLQIPNSMVYKAPDVNSTNVKYKRVLWRIFVMIIHDNFCTQTGNLISSFHSWALPVLTQIHQMVANIFDFTYRSILCTLFFPPLFLHVFRI